MKVSPLNLDDEGEYALLMKCWKHTKMLGDDWGKDFARKEVERAARLLRGRAASFMCIRNPNRESQVLAVAVYEDVFAHFVYVKRWFRRQGLAVRLIGHCHYATFWTEAARPLFEKLQLRRIDL